MFTSFSTATGVVRARPVSFASSFGKGAVAHCPWRPSRLTVRSSRRRVAASLKVRPAGAILAPHCRGRRGLTQALALLMTLSDISPVISALALGVSLFTAWYTILRRGTVRCTHPSFVAFRYDFIDKNVPQAKIFLRALLFSTGKRGRVVESLFLRVREGERSSEFSFWGHGDKELVRGSGLFVPETGVVSNHHFNPIDSDQLFRFSGGSYSLELVAKLVGQETLVSLWRGKLEIPAGTFDSTIARERAVFFSWSPERRQYIGSVENRSGAIHALSDPQG
jgi:hypothetical protein